MHKRLGVDPLWQQSADRPQDELPKHSGEEQESNTRLRSEGIGNGHAYSATGVTDASHDTICSPGPPNPKTMQLDKDYAALVALDWGDKKHAFARQMSGADGVESGEIEATPEALLEWLEALHRRCEGKPVALAIEAGRNALVHALCAHPWLRIYPVHPATSARFRRAFTPSGAKDDVPDAVSLLTLLRLHRDELAELILDQPQTRELAALVTARRQAVDARTGLGNQLTSLLKSYFPQALILAGEDLTKPMALAFLRRFPELAVAQKAGAAKLRAFYHKQNSRSESCIEKRLELLAKARPLTEDRAVIAPALLGLARLLDLLAVEMRHIAGWEKRIAACFAAHPKAELFASLPGAGPALAPRLLVALGDVPARYPDAHALQKYAGVAPVREKSGRQLWVHWRRGAPKFLRQTLVEWAGQTVVFCDWAKAFYRRQQIQGKRHHAILRALAFKWVRILWRCWKDNVPYDETRYLASLSKRGSPLVVAT
jgi:transposase